MRINRWALMALLFSLFAWAALLSPFYFTGAHDGRHSLFYQVQFLQGVQDGYWYPRWGPDFGFGRGYPFFIFYAPLTSYTVQAAHSWGMGVVASVKVSWALGFLLGAAGMFRLAKMWWKDDRAAFIAALLYTVVPYKLVDIYVRGAIAEFWSLALFPWAMLFFARLIRTPSATNIIQGGLLYGALILVHIATALLFSPFLGAYILFELALMWHETRSSRPHPLAPSFDGYQAKDNSWSFWSSLTSLIPQRGRLREELENSKKLTDTDFAISDSPLPLGEGLGVRERTMLTINSPSLDSYTPSPLRSMFAVVGGLALGLLNATIFWLPLALEQQYIDVTQYVPENYNFAIQFTDWSQFLSPFWGFDYAVAGPNDGMSFQLGVLPILLIVLSVWLLVQRKIKPLASARLIWALISLLVVVFCMTALAEPIWEAIRIAPMIQFPWRLLGVSALLLALLGGGAVNHLLDLLPSQEQMGLHPAIAIVALLVLYGSYSYTVPRFTPPNEREETWLTILDFQREYPDMAGRLTRSEVVPQSSPMEAQYEALEPLQKFRLIGGEATIEQTYYGSSTAQANIKVSQLAQIELMTYDYPGWQLYLNDEALPHDTFLPEGTIAFELPVGEYQITARFEDTSWRLAAKLISMLTIGLSCLTLLWKNWPPRRERTQI